MFNKRLSIFLLLLGCAAAVVVTRLVHMQLTHGREYARQSEESLKITRSLATHRGKILDRRGRILAVDQPCFEFTVAYPALLTNWAHRRTRALMAEQALSAEQAQQQVRQQLQEAQELALKEKWVRDQARALARREGADLTAAQRRELAEQIVATLPERIDWTLDRAAQVAGVPRQEVNEEIDRIVQRVWRVRAIVRMLVEEETEHHGVIHALDEVTAVALRGQLDEMVGAEVAPSARRWYPCGATASHAIGLTGRVSSEDVGLLWQGPALPAATRPAGTALADMPPEGDGSPSREGSIEAVADPSWPGTQQIAAFTKVESCPPSEPGHQDDERREYLPDERAGLTGAERLAEPVLRGVRGRQVHHRSGALLEQTLAVPGRDVHLTLDIDLQQAIEQDVLDERPENGAAVVLDVRTGQILVLASKPRYDLNTYRAKFASLLEDQANLPLMNRAVGCSYPPGSTVKPLVALAAAAEGLLTPEQAIECRGFMFPSQPLKFRCWIYKEHNGQHGPQTMREALRHSCNIYFYTAGERLGSPHLMDWLGRFGLGTRPGTLLPEEKPGRVPAAQWMWRHQSHALRTEDLCLMGIGQGMLEATPLQMANAMATVARGGVWMPPTLLFSAADDAGDAPSRRRDLKLPADALAAVQAGMSDVVNNIDGTAHNYAYDPELPEICGKTGTAQAAPRRIDSNHNGRLDASDQVVQSGDITWFAGYAPRHNPRIAFAVLVEYVSTGSGGTVCGPMAKQLVRICRDKGYLK
jgi:penicillin-binding protein 2